MIDTIGIHINSYDTTLILTAMVISFPDTIRALPGNEQITITWDSTDLQYIYLIYIYRDQVFIDSVDITSTEDTSYFDIGLTNYQDYSYFIRSKDIWDHLSIASDTITVFPCEIVTDYDKNKYTTVKIGKQVWMRENLKTTHYADGDSMSDGTGAGDITGNYTTNYYFWYNDDSATYATTYGALYTWAEAMNGAAGSNANPSGVQGACPDGWHLPSDAEWKEMEIYLGMSQTESDATGWRGTYEGGMMKESVTAHWNSPNTGAKNSSGFTELPGGYRYDYGNFDSKGNYALFWSSTEYNSYYAWPRALRYDNSEIGCNFDHKYYGFSVRCLKKPCIIDSFSFKSSPVSCYGFSDGSIDLTTYPEEDSYRYKWSHGDSTQCISGLTAGKYVVTVTDTLMCSLIDSISLSQPDPVPQPEVTEFSICNGQPACMYLVSTDLKFYSDPLLTTPIIPSGDTICFNYDSPDTYHYYVTQTINGCESQPANGILIVFKNPIVSVEPDSSLIIMDSTLILRANGAYNERHSWFPDYYEFEYFKPDSVAVSLDKNITYIVTGWDENNCTGTDSSVISVYCHTCADKTFPDDSGVVSYGYYCNYNPNDTCNWRISYYTKGTISLWFKTFDLQKGATLFIYTTEDTEPAARYYLDNSPPDTLTVEFEGGFNMRFISDGTEEGKGINVNYWLSGICDRHIGISESEETQLKIYPNPFTHSTIIE